MRQQIQMLQITLGARTLRRGIDFSKTIGTTLTAEQSARLDKALREKTAFLYQAKVDLLVARLSNALALRSERRNRIVSLLIEETRPPGSSAIPRSRLQSCFSRWPGCPTPVSRRFSTTPSGASSAGSSAPWRGREPYLRSLGYIPGDAGPVPDANQAEPAAKKHEYRARALSMTSIDIFETSLRTKIAVQVRSVFLSFAVAGSPGFRSRDIRRRKYSAGSDEESPFVREKRRRPSRCRRGEGGGRRCEAGP